MNIEYILNEISLKEIDFWLAIEIFLVLVYFALMWDTFFRNKKDKSEFEEEEETW